MANSIPSPSMKKLAFSPRPGSQSARAWITSPRNTAGACSRTPTSASAVVSPADQEQALRPARIRRAGNTAPRNGKAAIRNRDKSGTPF